MTRRHSRDHRHGFACPYCAGYPVTPATLNGAHALLCDACTIELAVALGHITINEDAAGFTEDGMREAA